MKQTIYLMFGGESPEHEISLITAKQVLKHIDTSLYDVFAIYLDKNNNFFYINNFSHFKSFSDFKALSLEPLTIKIEPPKKLVFQLGRFKNLPTPDICFLTFHGGMGEGGSLQGFLDILDIPYSGPSLRGAVYGMDKVVMKYILEANGINLLPWKAIHKQDWITARQDNITAVKSTASFPLIVKPASLGSSIGVKKVHNDEDLIDSIDLNFLYDTQVIVEQFGSNMLEVNCSVRKQDNTYIASPLEEVKNTDEILSYDDKYVKGGKKKSANNTEGMAAAKRKVPASLSAELTKQIQHTATQASKILQAESLVRIDFLVDQNNNIFYPIEINSIPGSLSYYLWEANGIQFHELINSLINEALKNFKQNKKLIRTFESPLWES